MSSVASPVERPSPIDMIRKARELTCRLLQRYFLAEIIKDSEIPPSQLVTMIQQMKVIPRWTEIALPNGMCTFCPVKVCQTRELKVLVEKDPLGIYQSRSRPES